jgi:hypothetical protein
MTFSKEELTAMDKVLDLYTAELSGEEKDWLEDTAYHRELILGIQEVAYKSRGEPKGEDPARIKSLGGLLPYNRRELIGFLRSRVLTTLKGM